MYSSTLHIMKVFDRDIHAHHIPFIVAAMVLLIVVTGGWVRISDAGESCPDWPTCFGELGFNISSEKQMEWWGENPDEAESIPVKFTWNILTKPDDCVIVKDEFGPIISPILMETVEKKLADGTLGYNDETRIDNIKQLDS